jgi:hypothetical protein
MGIRFTDDCDRVLHSHTKFSVYTPVRTNSWCVRRARRPQRGANTDPLIGPSPVGGVCVRQPVVCDVTRPTRSNDRPTGAPVNLCARLRQHSSDMYEYSRDCNLFYPAVRPNVFRCGLVPPTMVEYDVICNTPTTPVFQWLTLTCICRQLSFICRPFIHRRSRAPIVVAAHRGVHVCNSHATTP